MNVQKTWAMIASVVAFSLSMMFAPGQLVANGVSDATIDKVGVEIFGKDYNSVVAISKEDFDEKYVMSREDFSETYRSKTSNAERKAYKIDLKKKFKKEREEAAKIYKVGMAIYGQDFKNISDDNFELIYQHSRDEFRTWYGDLSSDAAREKFRADQKRTACLNKRKYEGGIELGKIKGRDADWIDDVGMSFYSQDNCSPRYFEGDNMKTFRGRFADSLNSIGEVRSRELFVSWINNKLTAEQRLDLKRTGEKWDTYRLKVMQDMIDSVNELH